MENCSHSEGARLCTVSKRVFLQGTLSNKRIRQSSLCFGVICYCIIGILSNIPPLEKQIIANREGTIREKRFFSRALTSAPNSICLIGVENFLVNYKTASHVGTRGEVGESTNQRGGFILWGIWMCKATQGSIGYMSLYGTLITQPAGRIIWPFMMNAASQYW